MLAGANVVGGPGGAGATGGTYTKLVAGAVAQVATQCCSARAAGPPAKTAKANRNGLMTFIVYFSSNFANTRLCWCASRRAASDERHAPSIKFVRLLSNLSAARRAAGSATESIDLGKEHRCRQRMANVVRMALALQTTE